jgi:hypothetical protein
MPNYIVQTCEFTDEGLMSQVQAEVTPFYFEPYTDFQATKDGPKRMVVSCDPLPYSAEWDKPAMQMEGAK